MAYDLNQINQEIDNSIKDQPARNIQPVVMRGILKKITGYLDDLTKGKLSAFFKVGSGTPVLNDTEAAYRTSKTIFGRNYSNGTGAALEATDAWMDTLNGNRVSPYFTITNSADGLAPTRYFAIGELPASSGATYDFAQLEFIGKPWDNGSGSPIELSIYLANRGGLRYQYTSRGDANSTGIIAQQMPDGRTVIYMASNNDFKALSARFVNSAQAIIYATPFYSSNLLGTEVFNSMKPTVYKPLVAFRSRFFTVPVINSDGQFPPAPLSEAGAAQLSLGANYVGGSSDLALINSNTAGGGISFWQQTGATAKTFLAWMTAQGNMIIGGSGGASPIERLQVVGNMLLQGILKFPASLANRKITLYDVNGNEHQFYGFGVQSGELRYQIDSSGAKHIFYAGASATTSVELMRIQGDGKVGINRSTALTFPFDVGGNNPSEAIIGQFINLPSAGNGAFIRLTQVDAGNWDLGLLGNNHFIIRGWNGAGAIVERIRITPDGRFLIGQSVANDRDLLQVNGSISGKVYKQGSNASASELPADSWRFVKNTANGELRLVVNDGGTIKSVLLS